MQRRKFIRNISLASLAIGLVPYAGMANLLPQNPSGFLIPLGEAQTQIRHGALNLPIALKDNTTMPFDWLVQVHRNIFFKNGFQASGGMDLEIISVLLEEEEGLEAMQIQLSESETTVMIKDQLLQIERRDGFQEGLVENVATQLLLGDLSAGQSYECEIESGGEVFVQLLEGAIVCNEQVLDLNTGLALEGISKLAFEGSRNSRVLVLVR